MPLHPRVVFWARTVASILAMIKAFRHIWAFLSGFFVLRCLGLHPELGKVPDYYTYVWTGYLCYHWLMWEDGWLFDAIRNRNVPELEGSLHWLMGLIALNIVVRFFAEVPDPAIEDYILAFSLIITIKDARDRSDDENINGGDNVVGNAGGEMIV